jgi:hypothetical protein
LSASGESPRYYIVVENEAARVPIQKTATTKSSARLAIASPSKWGAVPRRVPFVKTTPHRKWLRAMREIRLQDEWRSNRPLLPQITASPLGDQVQASLQIPKGRPLVMPRDFWRKGLSLKALAGARLSPAVHRKSSQVYLGLGDIVERTVCGSPPPSQSSRRATSAQGANAGLKHELVISFFGDMTMGTIRAASWLG